MSLRDRQRAVRITVKPGPTEVVSLRFRTADLDVIEEAANREGVLITDYIRRVVLAQARAKP